MLLPTLPGPMLNTNLGDQQKRISELQQSVPILAPPEPEVIEVVDDELMKTVAESKHELLKKQIATLLPTNFNFEKPIIQDQ